MFVSEDLLANRRLKKAAAIIIGRKKSRYINRARQLYKNIFMLFLFPVKDGKLSTGVIAIFNASCYG